MNNLVKLEILGVGITNAAKEEVLEYIFTNLKNPEKYYIVTPNPELIMLSQRDSNYEKILNTARISVVDGVGLELAVRFLKREKIIRFAGVDLMDSICKKASILPVRIGLLGAGHGVAERTAECLMKKYPGLNIVFISDEWGEEGFQVPAKNKVLSRKYQVNENLHTTNYILPTTIDFLFVAFGSPKQEKWISENIDNLPVKVMMGVGGAFDFISGEVSRAPVIVRRIGMEWLYRLFIQPWRWRRQIDLVKFILLVLKEKYNSRFHNKSHF